MATINLKIKNPNTKYYFLGDDILKHDVYIPVETSDLSPDVGYNILTALDADILESDISTEDIRQILLSDDDLIIVANISDRDNLPNVNEGDKVLVQDIGNGTWSKFVYKNNSWIEYEKESSPVIYNFKDLGDVDANFDSNDDNKIAQYKHSSNKIILTELNIPNELTSLEIKNKYESNSNTNVFTDSEKNKLALLSTNAINASNVVLNIPELSAINVADGLKELYDNKSDINHNHDIVYSQLSHTHSNYANINHNHDSLYSQLNHTHNDYALLNHSHSNYADINHNHNTDYANIIHNHDSRNDLRYSQLNHVHNNYADINHDHNGVYEHLIPTPSVNDQVLVKNTDNSYYFKDLNDLEKTYIDDSNTSLLTTFSSIKINDLLNNKSDINHNHDTVYSQLNHNHDDRYYIKSESDSLVLHWKGLYSNSIQYHINDIVEYNNSSYIAINDNINSLPINLTDWDLLAKQGEKGDQGDQGIQGIQGVPGAGIIPGGTTGQVLTKASNTNYDTVWTTPAGDYIIRLSPGVSLTDRFNNAQIPAGWTIQDGQTANHPNFGNGDDTLVINHNTGQMVANINVWEIANSGPDIAKGSTQIDLTTQGQIKNSLDQNSFAVINFQALTNTVKSIFIYMKLV